MDELENVYNNHLKVQLKGKKELELQTFVENNLIVEFTEN